jgi:hypothetical protein
VIALAGTSGLPVAFRTLPRHKTDGKKRKQPETAKLQARNSIKRVIWEKYPFKTVFSIGVDTTTPQIRKRDHYFGKRSLK